MPRPTRYHVQEAIDAFRSRYGDAALARLGDPHNNPSLSTGSLALDLALSGGYRREHLVEISGPVGSGKTTLALMAAASVQRTGNAAAIIGPVPPPDSGYARRLGVDNSALLVSQPPSGEAAMEIAQRLLKYCSVGLLVLDSLYALFSRDLPGLASTSPANLGGRLMGTAMRDLSALAKRYHVYIIFLTPTFPEAIPLLDNGNKSLAFYSSQRLELQKIDPLISKDELSRVRVRVIKNALDSLPDPVELDISHNVGVSQASEILDLGLKLGLVTRSGPWFSYAGLNLGQGRDNTIEHLTLDRLLADRIQQDVIAKFHESTPKVETPLVEENQQ